MTTNNCLKTMAKERLTEILEVLTPCEEHYLELQALWESVIDDDYHWHHTYSLTEKEQERLCDQAWDVLSAVEKTVYNKIPNEDIHYSYIPCTKYMKMSSENITALIEAIKLA